MDNARCAEEVNAHLEAGARVGEGSDGRPAQRGEVQVGAHGGKYAGDGHGAPRCVFAVPERGNQFAAVALGENILMGSTIFLGEVGDGEGSLREKGSWSSAWRATGGCVPISTSAPAITSPSVAPE